MKKTILIAAAALFVLSAPKKTTAQEISFGLFYNSLAPYGQWVNAGSYGMCWRPSGMPAYWRPYTAGHWVWSDYGWTWVSNYHWGWAPFHYGRWVLDPVYGWVWVPGYVWGPAWVQWRWGGGYCGWAPLPPGNHFRVDVVIGPNIHDFGVGWREWNFISAREMGLDRYRYIDRDAVPHAIARTRNVTRFRFTSRGVYDEGLSREEVERVSRRRIETVSVTRTNDIGRQRIIGNRIDIYSPAPFKPRFRNEEEVIKRERVYRVPEKFRSAPQQRGRATREINRTRTEPQREPAKVEQRKGENVRPGRPAREKPKQNARERDKNNKEKGPGRGR